MVDEPAALIWAANFGALEWHAWTSRIDQPDQPDYALIDIDPGEATSWEDLLVLARLHRTALDHLGVRGQPKVTGRRGIQIWIPVARGPSFDDTRAWVEQLSKAIGAVVPELVSWKWQVRERGGLARLDYTQNVHNKTLVAPTARGPRPARRCPRRSTGTSSTTRACGRTASRSGTCWLGWPSAAICSPPCWAAARCCQRSASSAQLGGRAAAAVSGWAAGGFGSAGSADGAGLSRTDTT